MINIDVVVVWSCAQPWDCRKVARQNNDESGSPRNPEIPDGNLETRWYPFSVGIGRERVLSLGNTNRQFPKSLRVRSIRDTGYLVLVQSNFLLGFLA